MLPYQATRLHLLYEMTKQLSNADYHADPAVSKSDLDAAHQSGRHFFDKKNGLPRPSTPNFNFGTGFHALALPGESLDSVAVRMPEGMKKTTKEGKAFVAEHAGKIIFNSTDAHCLDQMMLSLREHPVSSALVNGELAGKSEQSFFATEPETGLEVKCRPDFMLNDGSLIIDLKTTTDASPKGFQKSLVSFRYFVQAAWYLDVVELATGKRPEGFLFVAVEKQRPFSTGVYVADEEMIKIGREHAMEDLRNIAKWKAEDNYPGYSDRAEMISLPKWMLPKEDGSPNTDHQPIELY
jgi:exodeoxyribonuclease VIII